MGLDRRGVWVDDKRTGTKIRLGDVSMNMAHTLYEQGNRRAGEDCLRRPKFGLWFSKSF